MNFPLGTILANIFICHLENICDVFTNFKNFIPNMNRTRLIETLITEFLDRSPMIINLIGKLRL